MHGLIIVKTKVVIFLLSTFLGAQLWAAPPLCKSIFISENSRGVGTGLPVFSLDQIFIQKHLSRGNFEALLNDGQRIFLKKLRGGSETEIAWLQKINSLGLGVELLGRIKIQDQNYAVLEYFEGVNTQIPMMAPSDFILSKVAITEIRRQTTILAANGIIPVDLQFQVSLDGKSVKIVDPELFQMAQAPEEAGAKSQSILMNLLMPWTLEGKAEL